MKKIKVYRLIISFFLITLTSGCGEKKDITKIENIGGMVLIPGGTFEMGGNSHQSSPDEFPRRKVKVNKFFMDTHEVTNSQFKEFIDSTGYVTLAERKIDWKEMKKSLPAGTPKPPEKLLAAGSIVFKGTGEPVSLHDETQWWEWTTGANWRHPRGP